MRNTIKQVQIDDEIWENKKDFVQLIQWASYKSLIKYLGKLPFSVCKCIETKTD